jgi:aspartyl-tRNA(Asn)/glutamyl-tRNA(Gln) amidotransferase subunit C
MKINKELLAKIATNARLELSEEEVQEFLPQLQEVLDLFSSLDELDTINVKPSFQPIEVTNILREDVVQECLPIKEVFLGVKNKQENYFKGPKAI